MDIFLKRVTSPQEESQAGPSGEIPEDPVIMGNGDSMCVVAPKDLPVGQYVEMGDSDIDDSDPV